MTKRQIMRIERRAAELAANETDAALDRPFYLPPGRIMNGWYEHGADGDPKTDDEWAGWLCREIGLHL